MGAIDCRGIEIVEHRGSHLLVRRGPDFAIVERRNGRVYRVTGGAREDFPDTPLGLALAIGADWGEEAPIRQQFDEITKRGDELAQKIW